MAADNSSVKAAQEVQAGQVAPAVLGAAVAEGECLEGEEDWAAKR